IVSQKRVSAVSFLSSRRRHTRSKRDWSSDVCSSDLGCSVETQRHLLIRALACTVNPSSDDLEQQVNFAPVSVPRNLVALLLPIDIGIHGDGRLIFGYENLDFIGLELQRLLVSHDVLLGVWQRHRLGAHVLL